MATIPRERLDRVEQLYLAGHGDGEIQRVVATQYGVTRRAVRRYLQRVKARLVARAKTQDPDAARQQILGMVANGYHVAAAAADPKAMVSAARVMAEVQGLLAAQRFEHAGPAGAPIQAQLVAQVVVLPALDDDRTTAGDLATEPRSPDALPE